MIIRKFSKDDTDDLIFVAESDNKIVGACMADTTATGAGYTLSRSRPRTAKRESEKVS